MIKCGDRNEGDMWCAYTEQQAFYTVSKICKSTLFNQRKSKP